MNNQLNFNAVMAWTAFGVQDYSGLEQYGGQVYNYFVHNPCDILKLDNPLLIGKVFQVCLGFQEPDEDIQEVRAENAFLCFSQALKSDKAMKVRYKAYILRIAILVLFIIGVILCAALARPDIIAGFTVSVLFCSMPLVVIGFIIFLLIYFFII